MSESEHWEDPIWRGRFKGSSPLALLKVAERDATSRVATLALEELERKIVAIVGASPQQTSPAATPQPTGNPAQHPPAQ